MGKLVFWKGFSHTNTQLQKIPVEKFRGGVYNKRDGTNILGIFSVQIGEE